MYTLIYLTHIIIQGILELPQVVLQSELNGSKNVLYIKFIRLFIKCPHEAQELTCV